LTASLTTPFVSFAFARVGGFLANELGTGMSLLTGAIIVYVPSALIFAGATTAATWRLRTPSPRHSLKRDAVLSLVAITITPAVILGTIWLGCSVSYCGA
jgi:hypothetical protein